MRTVHLTPFRLLVALNITLVLALTGAVEAALRWL